jgi:hypothetical protein
MTIIKVTPAHPDSDYSVDVDLDHTIRRFYCIHSALEFVCEKSAGNTVQIDGNLIANLTNFNQLGRGFK